MNILLDELPEELEIEGVGYEINCDFKTCIKIITAFEDEELASQEKYSIMLSLLYKEIPSNIQLAIDNALWFLDGGEEDGENGSSGNKHRLYSFAKDHKMIYAAFRQTHGIDLQEENMHWWKFLALFMDMGANTSFSSIVNLRKRVKNNTATKEERKAASEMGDLFHIPEHDNRTLQQKIEDNKKLKIWEDIRNGNKR